MSARDARLGALVAEVARQALGDHGARRVALLDDGGPEAELAARWLEAGLGPDAVVRVRTERAVLEPVLRIAGARPEEAEAEVRRMLARLVPDSIPALAANKTALLLGGPLPPEPFLPLGDLYASEVGALAGDWSGPEAVRGLAEAAGGVEPLDAALRARIDGREPGALERIPAGDRVRAALERGAASRLAARIVPKIGVRTLGVDLFE